MSWIEKDQSASFENQALEGLFFLDGDVIAAEIGLDWTRGQKFPRLAFPSGLKFDLWEGRNSPIVHLFGELDLALHATRDEAFEHAFVEDPTRLLSSHSGRTRHARRVAQGGTTTTLFEWAAKKRANSLSVAGIVTQRRRKPQPS